MIKNKAEALLNAKFGPAKSAELIKAGRSLKASGASPDEVAEKLATKFDTNDPDTVVPSVGIVVVAL